MTEQRKSLWTERLMVRWGDMDALGHVNNTEYFRYMEQTRIAWFDALGIPILENGFGPVIARATCDFITPITYPATVSVATYLQRLGRSSFTVTHELRPDTDPAALFATGEVVVVWVDHAQGKSMPLPARVRQALE
jgi:acyl-CoA thioester hydrolase